jgi:tripartite-type tricarboxylate transporter receptor subunit TctC
MTEVLHMFRKKILLIIPCVILALLFTSMAFGESKYPEKNITFICPWSPGGSSDTITRALAQSLKKNLGKSVIVVNRDGANGMVATTENVNTKPDGYTLIQGASGLFVTQPYAQKNLGFKESDFDFLIGVTNEPIVLTVNANSPYAALQDLIKAAKAKNLVIRYSNSGMGGFPQLSVAELSYLAGFKSQPVPFKGGAGAMTAILGGHVDLAVSHPGEAIPHIKAGKLRPLAITSAKRFPGLANVPTLKELGYKIDMGVTKFVFTPKGLPSDVRATLVSALEKSVNDPDFKKAIEAIYVMHDPMSGKELQASFAAQRPVMKRLIEEIQKAEAK